VCLVLCVTSFPYVTFLADLKVFSYILCLIILICVELKFITHARIELIIHACTMLLVFYTVAVVNIDCHECKNCGRLVAVAFVTSQDDIVDLQQLIVTLSPYSYSLHYN
jgi:hypothetical protein